MTFKTFISAISVFVFASCGNRVAQDRLNQETPKALEDKSSLSEVVSMKRGYDGLVESLYNEAVSKNIDLRKLEDEIGELNKAKNDSTVAFDKFDGNNQSYFSSANEFAEQIKDTLMKSKMKAIIFISLTKYNASIAKHNEFLKIIDAKNLTISDLHHVLKIVKTLPVMKKYQKDNLPDTRSLDGLIKQQDKVIRDADALIKK